MRLLAALALCLIAVLPASAAERFDEAPRIAVMSAFPPELKALASATQNQKRYTAAGVTFVTGELEGKPVVLFLSGVSMVNAAMTTQLALDRFNISRIVFSGIAGGVDESLDIGDVIVADQWSQNLETAFARETESGFQLSASMRNDDLPAFGMMIPRSIMIARGDAPPERRRWFPVDKTMLETARAIAPTAPLSRCVASQCLVHAPKVVVGGNGISAPVFLDNAAYRKYARATFQARVVDMESAAVAHVAYANGAPFIAFRSLSDLAGGGDEANEMHTFLQLASDNSASVVKAFVKALPN
ncbi:5'-methylthioadenosine/S-adenosylhomocysteine nucleosidase [Caulobacter henricii]|uniref:Phosphorylase n=1 Tax=Caulobacter henricii TaxID=69395 RepID=A0A0N7JHB9_9CAUL|nr:5'-methylthioadenosine/S-adenosylhomocysteine nucleosidase [Caulobacter henricii]ALL12962.1 phosphorylase [Caulobacter henricii]